MVFFSGINNCQKRFEILVAKKMAFYFLWMRTRYEYANECIDLIKRFFLQNDLLQTPPYL